MNIEQFIETLQPEIESKRDELTANDFISWLESQVKDWDVALGKPRARGAKMQKRFKTIRNFYNQQAITARGDF